MFMFYSNIHRNNSYIYKERMSMLDTIDIHPQIPCNSHLKLFIVCNLQFIILLWQVQESYAGLGVTELNKQTTTVRPTIKDYWMLLHDNAPHCHTAFSITEILTNKNMSIVTQPLYSPDLSPCNIFLFLKLKSHFKEHHFLTVRNIEKTVSSGNVVVATLYRW